MGVTLSETHWMPPISHNAIVSFHSHIGDGRSVYSSGRNSNEERPRAV
ncbi:TPA: hypothetical protein PY773_002891 [Staphylococcus aureus]|nr:hypothetical protein [Staphylococcus aureus]